MNLFFLYLRLTMAFWVLCAGSLFAQSPGDLDSTFGNGGKVTTLLPSAGLWGPSPALLQPDGKIIVSMGVYSPPNASTLYIARYLIDGSLDPSWGQNGITAISITGATMIYSRSIKYQPDGKILIGGQRDTVLGSTGSFINPLLLRLTSDGVLDATFGNGGIVNLFEPRHIYTEQLLLIGNQIMEFGFDGSILRLRSFNMSDGTANSSWGNNGQVEHNTGTTPISAQRVILQPDNKIIFASYLFTRRYLPNGNLDSLFGANNQGYIEAVEAKGGSGLHGAVSVVLQNNQQILIGGRCSPTSLYYGNAAIERYDSNGVLDNNFANHGVLIVDYQLGESELTSVEIQHDGKIIAAGHAKDTATNDYFFALARYDSLGMLDSLFGNNGVVITDFHPNDSLELSFQTFIQPDKKIVMAGHSALYSQSIGSQPLNSLNLVRYYGDSVTISQQQILPTPNSRFDFYPNPAKSSIQSLLSIKTSGHTELSIYDLQGRKVQQLLNKEMAAGEYQLTFNLAANLASGVYVLKLQTEKEQYAKMLVIE